MITFVKTSEKSILCPVSSDENMIIEALNADVVIIDPDFKNFGSDGMATPETAVICFELIKNANFAEMFNAFSNKLDALAFTKDQIVSFCGKYPHKLEQDGNPSLFLANFFLYKNKKNNKFFVAIVSALSSGIGLGTNSLQREEFWHSTGRHRVWVPATCSLKS